MCRSFNIPALSYSPEQIGDVPRGPLQPEQPQLQPQHGRLADYGLELPREVQLPGEGVLDAGPVLRPEVVGAAAAPVHHVPVLALATEFALPVGHVQVVVHVGVAEAGVAQRGVEERLGRQQGVLEDPEEAGDEVVGHGIGHVP